MEQNDPSTDPFETAKAVQFLRDRIHAFASFAVKYGVNRDWANQRLNRMGAPVITGTATYQLNVPITGVFGKTVTASSRAEAMEKFAQHATRVSDAGVIDGTDCDRVFEVAIGDGAPVFYSGPEDFQDAYTGTVPGTVANQKDAIRSMLMEGVSEQGWVLHYANLAADDMGVEPLPNLVGHTVQVPVSGTASITVETFEGSDPDAIQRAATARLRRAGVVTVKPDEIGLAFTRPGSEAMGLKLVDEDDDNDMPI